MVGTQAIAAYKLDGAMTVKTLDIKSYDELVPGKLSYEVWDMSAEESGGVVRLFAKIKVPEKGTNLNHVWQVGPSVTKGRLDVHGFSPANKNAKGTLNLDGGQSSSVGGVDSRTKRKNVSSSFFIYFFA